MKRDMDLIRTLMLLLEEQEDANQELKLPATMDKKEAIYHLKLLEQAGYALLKIQGPGDNVMWIYSSLTWDGHEFLSAIKNDTVWSKVKQETVKQGGNIPFEVLKTLAIQVSTKLFLG